MFMNCICVPATGKSKVCLAGRKGLSEHKGSEGSMEGTTTKHKYRGSEWSYRGHLYQAQAAADTMKGKSKAKKILDSLSHLDIPSLG